MVPLKIGGDVAALARLILGGMMPLKMGGG